MEKTTKEVVRRRLPVYFTDDTEYEEIEAAAARADISMSLFCRIAAVGLARVDSFDKIVGGLFAEK